MGGGWDRFTRRQRTVINGPDYGFFGNIVQFFKEIRCDHVFETTYDPPLEDNDYSPWRSKTVKCKKCRMYTEYF